mgnify:FL=1
MKCVPTMSKDPVPKKVALALKEKNIIATSGYFTRGGDNRALFTAWDEKGKVVAVLKNFADGWRIVK